jgi:hypothetical protein
MGVSGQRHAPAALLPPGKGPTVPIVQEAGWAPEPVWTQRLEEKSFAPAGDRKYKLKSLFFKLIVSSSWPIMADVCTDLSCKKYNTVASLIHVVLVIGQ